MLEVSLADLLLSFFERAFSNAGGDCLEIGLLRSEFVGQRAPLVRRLQPVGVEIQGPSLTDTHSQCPEAASGSEVLLGSGLRLYERNECRGDGRDQR